MAARSWRTAVTLVIALAVLTPLVARADGHDSQGRRLFEAKGCVRCHVTGGREGGIPALEELRRPQGEWHLAGRLWNHVPAMFTALASRSVPWPTFTPEEMSLLMVYLGANPSADPAPEPQRGLAALVQKGCLKCHALRGEGGRTAPDFGTRTDAFASPAVWAARIWRHTPTMASAAMAQGLSYPRFTAHEMAQLIAYLKQSGSAPPAR